MGAEALRFTLAIRQGDMPTPNRMICNYILNYRIAYLQFSCQSGLAPSCGSAWSCERACLWADEKFLKFGVRPLLLLREVSNVARVPLESLK